MASLDLTELDALFAADEDPSSQPTPPAPSAPTPAATAPAPPVPSTALIPPAATAAAPLAAVPASRPAALAATAQHPRGAGAMGDKLMRKIYFTLLQDTQIVCKSRWPRIAAKAKALETEFLKKPTTKALCTAVTEELEEMIGRKALRVSWKRLHFDRRAYERKYLSKDALEVRQRAALRRSAHSMFLALSHLSNPTPPSPARSPSRRLRRSSRSG